MGRAPRLFVATSLLLAFAVGAGALAGWSLISAAPGASGAFPVLVLGPDGAPLVDARVELDGATALAALQAACARAGVAIETEHYPGMGTYVRAIGGHRAEGASGWVYEVERDGATVSGDRSADAFPLRKGDALRWRWTNA